jgi:predicted lipid-binding transport protein (Tim44 family)
MDSSGTSDLTYDQRTLLTELAEMENARLEEAASAVTQQAFNLGCLVGLLPGGIILLATLLLIGFSFIGAAMAFILMLTGLIAFANLAAMLARRNTVRRIYRDQSQTAIETALHKAELSQDQFGKIAREVLPPQAALCTLLPPAAQSLGQEPEPGSAGGN